MSTPPDEPKTHTNRRSVKHFKLSGSHQPLNHQARFSISQLLHSKATAQTLPDTDHVSLTIGAYHDAPLKGRMHTSYVFPTVGTRGFSYNNCIYTYHPSSRLDLQSPLALASSNTDSPPDLLNEHYITCIFSNDSTTDNAFSIYIKIFNTSPQDILHLRMLELTEMQTQSHDTNPTSLPNIATVQSFISPPYHTEIDDEPIFTTTLLVDPNIPYLHIITLSTHSQPTYSLTLIASRQVRWSTSIMDTMIPPSIPEDTRNNLLLQVPTTIRRNVITSRPARDPCTIYNPALQGKSRPPATCSSGRWRSIPYLDASPATNTITKTLLHTRRHWLVEKPIRPK